MVSGSSFNEEISFPSTNTLPEVGLSRPPSIWRSVDLPLPDVPTTAANSPFSMARFTFCNACTALSPEP